LVAEIATVVFSVVIGGGLFAFILVFAVISKRRKIRNRPVPPKSAEQLFIETGEEKYHEQMLIDIEKQLQEEL
jgi:hypothetical protein